MAGEHTKEKYLDIKEVVKTASKLLGRDAPEITERTFRYWESESLISSNVERGEKNKKLYSIDVIKEVIAIRELEVNFKLKVEDIKLIKRNNNIANVAEFLRGINSNYNVTVFEYIIGLFKTGKSLETIRQYDMLSIKSTFKSEDKIDISRHGLADLKDFIFDIHNRKIIKKVIIISPWITDLKFLEELLNYSKDNLFKIVFFIRNSNENKDAIVKIKCFPYTKIYYNDSLHAKTYIVETSYGYRNFVYIGSSNFSKASSNLEEIGVMARLNDSSKLYHEIKNVISYLGGSKDTKSLG